MASVHKKGNRYYVVFRIPGGKQKWVPGGKTKAEANRRRIEIESRLVRGEFRELKRATFAEFSALWMSEYPVLRGMKPQTIRDYRSAFNAHLVPAFGERDLATITLEDLQRFVTEKLAAGSSPRRVADILIPLKTMFKYAVKWHYLHKSPAEELRKPRFDTPEMDFLTPEEAHRLIDAIDPYYRPFLLYLFMTGVRPGEAIATRWKDIDLERQITNVRYTMDRGVLLPPKTHHARRRIPMPPQLVSALEEHRRVCPTNPKDLVFVQPRSGTPIDLANFRNRVFYPALERAGLRRVRVYDIRHSYAAWMISLNVEPLQLSKNLGHFDIAFTYKTYGHLMPVSGHDQAAKLGAMFGEARREAAAEESRAA